MNTLVRRLTIGATLVASSASAQTIAITGGTVYPVTGPSIANGTVLMRDGKIVAVGKNVAIPSGATRVDATGKWVTPGLVDAESSLGLGEVGFSGDQNEQSAKPKEGIAASFKVWLGFNPNSVLIAPARQGGVTTVVIFPQGGLVAGQAAALDLVPGALRDMTMRTPTAMIAQIGDDRSADVGAKGQLFGRLRELLNDTKDYARRRAEFERAQTRPFVAGKADLEAMIPVVEGKLPLVIAADQASDIQAALQLAADYKIKIILYSASEGWMVASAIAAAKVPVLVGAENNIPSSFQQLASRQENAAILRKAGVAVSLVGNGAGDEDRFNVRNLRYEAGNAVAYGMEWADALRAITLAPAEAFGVADRVGSLQAGREGNVIVWSGDPFEFSTRAEAVFVHGKQITDLSRQDMLTQRYKTLPPKD